MKKCVYSYVKNSYKYVCIHAETFANFKSNDICLNVAMSLASGIFEEKEAINTHMHLRDTYCSVNGKQSLEDCNFSSALRVSPSGHLVDGAPLDRSRPLKFCAMLNQRVNTSI